MLIIYLIYHKIDKNYLLLKFFIFVDSHDPGWNDPPIFTYDKAAAIQTAAATKKGVTLNKRVAFPIEGKINLPQNESSTNNAFNIPSSKPPSCQMPPLPVKVTQSALKSESDETNLNSKTSNIEKDKINKIKQNFQIDSNCDNEILKRFKIMETMWNDDKLDNDVRLKIFELSEGMYGKIINKIIIITEYLYLSLHFVFLVICLIKLFAKTFYFLAYANNNLDLANRIQQGLMVDKISQCSSWMSGIRQLINQKRSFSS